MMADSNDIRDEFSPLLDDELTQDARDEVERELAQDAELLRELDALRRMDALYRGLPRAGAPDDLAARVREEVGGKSNVTPIRTRRIPVALYSGLAAAAIFMVVIGGIVVRQEFVVTPSPEERAETAALRQADAEQNEADAAAAQPEPVMQKTAAFDDATAPADELEKPSREALRDERPEGAVVEEQVELRRMQADRTPEQERTEPPSAAAGGRAADGESKDEAAPMPQAIAASPPPPPPAPEEAQATEQAATAAAGLAEPSAADADADAASRALQMQADEGALRKRLIDTREIGGRVFEQRDDGWYERGYDGERTRIVQRESDSLEALAPRVRELDAMLALEGDVVFRLDERWYRIPAKDAGQP